MTKGELIERLKALKADDSAEVFVIVDSHSDDLPLIDLAPHVDKVFLITGDEDE